MLLDRALHDDYGVHLGDPFGHPGHYIVRCAAVIALRQIGDERPLTALKQVPSETLAAVNEYMRTGRFFYSIIYVKGG